MKKLLLLSLVIFTFITYADDNKYTNAMKKNLSMIDTASTPASFQMIANSFERIAKAEKDKWLPYYYASYLITISAYMDTIIEKKDPLLDRAEGLISVADSLDPDNSEIYTVKAMVAQGRLIVDPQNRWKKYGQMFSGFIKKAEEFDPSNPRPVFLNAQNILHTPEQFGGGKEKAIPVFKEAAEKFENFQPASELHPDWGKDITVKTLESLVEEK